MTDQRNDEMPDEIKEAIDHFEEKYIPSFSKKSKRLLKVLINAAKARQNYHDLWIAERNASRPLQPRDLSPPVPDDVASAIALAEDGLRQKHRPPVAGLVVLGQETVKTLIRAASAPSAGKKK